MLKYDTNLAAEFYVLSMLHRLGAEASLTLGNKKSVDIFIYRSGAETKTLDVKGVSKRYDWPADNISLDPPLNHYVALVCFEGRIDDPEFMPNVWIIPAIELKRFRKHYMGTTEAGRTVISRKKVKDSGGEYLHAWGGLVPDWVRPASLKPTP